MDWNSFILVSLAVWRITHLLSEEDGPFDLVFLLRKKAGAGFFGNLLDCFYCLSIWVSLPFAAWVADSWFGILLCWLSISGAACLLQRITDKSQAPRSD